MKCSSRILHFMSPALRVYTLSHYSPLRSLHYHVFSCSKFLHCYISRASPGLRNTSSSCQRVLTVTSPALQVSALSLFTVSSAPSFCTSIFCRSFDSSKFSFHFSSSSDFFTSLPQLFRFLHLTSFTLHISALHFPSSSDFCTSFHALPISALHFSCSSDFSTSHPCFSDFQIFTAQVPSSSVLIITNTSPTLLILSPQFPRLPDLPSLH
jgi:hypothetical protein